MNEDTAFSYELVEYLPVDLKQSLKITLDKMLRAFGHYSLRIYILSSFLRL